MLYKGFEPRTPPSQFLRSNGTAIATEIYCGLSISYALVTISLKLSDLPDSVRFAGDC